MSSWSQGYVADTEYTAGYYREINPAIHRLALLNRGLAPPVDLDRPFRYCELGSGQGFGLNLLAASYPQAEFWGCDFNPAQVLRSRQLAAEAGLSNIRFSDQDFRAFGERNDLGAFDIVALHGIWSWITAENQAQIVDFLDRHLRVGGYVYVSYNAEPGWTGMAPVRALMRRVAPEGTGNSTQRIGAALDFMTKLREEGQAGYFVANPNIAPRLEKLAAQPRNYLAHELFNANWQPCYFFETAAAMERAKLGFAGSAHILDHVEIVCLAEAQRKFLATIADPTDRETVRDYMTNTQFRRDLFVKGAVAAAPSDRQAMARAQRFALIAPPDSIEMKQKFPIGEIGLQEAIYRPVIDRLAEGATSVEELLAIPELGQAGLASVWQACLILVGLGKAEPAAPPMPERAERAARFNDAVAAAARTHDLYRNLASPVFGGGVGMNRLQLLFRHARAQGQDPVATAWEALAAQGQKLVKDGKPLDTAEENQAHIRAELARFDAELAPLHRSLETI